MVGIMASNDRHSTYSQKYEVRSTLPGTPSLVSYLLRLMAAKRTNLCLSADVHSTSQLLDVAEECGDRICILKTHADTISDFGEKTIKGLMEIAARKKFLLFEDRKFGDIGNTVQAQYASGTHRIAHWASIVNAHAFPGPDIISSLHEAANNALAASNSRISTEITGGAPLPPGYFPPTPRSARFAGDDAASMTSFPEEDETPSAENEMEWPTSTPIDYEARKNSVVSIRTEISSSTEYISPPDTSPVTTPFTNQIPPQVPLARGLLLLAQMSSRDNLLGPEYTKRCVEMARDHKDFVLGFIAQEALNCKPDDNFVVMTPGVSLPSLSSVSRSSSRSSNPNGNKLGSSMRKGVNGLPYFPTMDPSDFCPIPTDGKGQQYNTPRRVILEKGVDIIIVGRGILNADSRVDEAERYRQEGWAAYLQRVEEDMATVQKTFANDFGFGSRTGRTGLTVGNGRGR